MAKYNSDHNFSNNSGSDNNTAMKSTLLKASGLVLLTAAVISNYIGASDINVLSMVFLAACLYVSGRILERKISV